MKDRILISACLLGICCRYTGDGKRIPEAEQLLNQYELIPICPEQLGGLSTPRPPSERIGERVLTNEGKDVTEQFVRGAEETLKIARLYNVKRAVLKERSPSCGFEKIYDGSFSGKIVDGNGITAEILSNYGLEIFGESDVHSLMKGIKK